MALSLGLAGRLPVSESHPGAAWSPAPMQANEKAPQGVQFMRDAAAYYASLGVRLKQLLTDNGATFKSPDFAAACKDLGIQHRFTRAYRPQTNGKVEGFIQSALREWAYGWTYQNSRHRSAALASWMHHYNWHRPHSGIGDVAPMTKLNTSGHNVLTLHT